MKKILLILSVFLSVQAFGQKCLIDNGNIEQIGLPNKYERPNGDLVLYGYGSMADTVHYNDGWRDVITPSFNDSTQYLGSIFYDETEDVCTYPVITKTTEELEAEERQRLNNIDSRVNLRDVEILLAEVLKDKLDSLDEQTVKHAISVYPVWREGVAYKAGNVVVQDSVLYKVIQPHVSQGDWKPATTPSLFTAYNPPGTISVFVQPTGAHDAYMTGDKVYYPTENDAVYESLIDNNVYSPDAYPAGWEIQ